MIKRIAKTVLGSNLISLSHLLAGKPKHFLRASQRAFIYARLTPHLTADIPVISLDQILGDRKPTIRLSVQKYEPGMLPSEQAMVLLAILVAESPSEVLEIGTFMGHTTRLMAENLENAIIHTADLPENFSPDNDPEKALVKDDFHLINARTVGREFKSRPCSKRIVQHFVDTATWDFAVGDPSFFFIDGSHTYDYCKNDSEKCFAVSGGKGVFLWHDCDDTHPGVVRFIKECRAKGMDIRLILGTPIAYWKSTPLSAA
jgi:hypothetical protein